MNDQGTESKLRHDSGSPCPSDNLDGIRTSRVVETPDYKKEPLSGLPAIEELKEYLQTNFDLLDLHHAGRITALDISSIARKVADLSYAASLQPDFAKASENQNQKPVAESGTKSKNVDPVSIDTGYTEEMFLANDFSNPHPHPRLRQKVPDPAESQSAVGDVQKPPIPPDPTEAAVLKKLVSGNGKKDIEALNSDLFHL
jgi:hypothetical protein